MTYSLSDEQELIQKTVRELAQGGITDRAVEADLASTFPRENVKELAAMGLLGITLDPDIGGAGADSIAYAIACEELAAGCATTGAFVALTNAWVTTPLADAGNDHLRETWLPRLLTGEALGTHGLHEDAVGADPLRIRAVARPVISPDDGAEDETRDQAAPDDPASEVHPARLSGTKDLTFLVGTADLAMVVARRGGGDPTRRRVDLYAVPTDRDGVAWGSDDSKLGLRGYPAGPLYLTKVPLEPTDLVGAPGDGPALARRSMQMLTIGTAACAIGLARASLEACVRFATDREQFGRPIKEYQAIQHMAADMKTDADMARNLVYAAASRFDRAGDAAELVEEANVVAFRSAIHATRLGIRLHGGAGFMRDLPVERYARDVRTLATLGRMQDVSKTLIGSHVLHAGE